MKYAENVAITFITRLLQVLFRLLGGIVVARVLGPAALGAYALMQMVVSVAVTLGNLGINGSIVYYAGRRKEEIHYLAANALLLGMLQGTALILLVVAGLLFFQLGPFSLLEPDWNLWLLLLLSIPFQLLILNFNALLQGQNKIGLFNKNSFIIALINLLLIVILLVPVDTGLLGRVLAYTLGSVLGAAAAFWAVKGLYQRRLTRPDRSLARDMLKFGSIINAITFIQFLNYRLDIFLLGYYCNTVDVGHYYVAVTLGEMLWYLPNAVGIVLFPILAGGGEKDSRLTMASARNNLLLITLMSVVVFVGAELIVSVFFSAAYLPAVQPLRAILPGIVGFSLAKILSPDLINRGLARVIAAISLGCLMLNVIFNLFLIPLYGATGAAIASSISYLAGVVLLVGIFRKVTGSGLREILMVNGQDIQGYLEFCKEIFNRFNGRCRM